MKTARRPGEKNKKYKRVALHKANEKERKNIHNRNVADNVYNERERARERNIELAVRPLPGQKLRARAGLNDWLNLCIG